MEVVPGDIALQLALNLSAKIKKAVGSVEHYRLCGSSTAAGDLREMQSEIYLYFGLPVAQ